MKVITHHVPEVIIREAIIKTAEDSPALRAAPVAGVVEMAVVAEVMAAGLVAAVAADTVEEGVKFFF